MSKTLTLADLTEALKPINLALKQMKEERTQNDAQLHEIHNMAVENSTKLDLFSGHFASIMASLSSQPAPKKLAGRKGSAKKAPAKKTTKKSSKKGGDDENDENEDNDNPENDEDEKDENEKDENEKDGSDAEESGSKKKKTVKKAPAKKPVKKEPVKKTAKTTRKKEPAKKQTKLNKMQYFKKAFEDDPSTFDKFLTPKVKKTLDTENKEKFDSLEGDKLQKEKINVYYKYFRDNHSDELDKMRDAYVSENADGDAEEGEDAGDAEEGEDDGDE